MTFGKKNSEKSMVQALRRGDNAAMRAFHALYSGRLAAVCSRYVADDDDVKDVLQDSMLAMITHIDSFDYRGEGALLAWATRIVVTQSLAFLKSRKRLPVVSLDDDANAISLGDSEPAEPDTDGIPTDAILGMVRQLPDGYRTVFNLFVVEGRSHKDIAAMLGIKEASSASQLHRAKAILARQIKEYKTLNC